MTSINITKDQAKLFMLTYQNLRPPYSLRDKKGILSHISHVGCIQFDPLNIVGHNQELVLQSRIAGFKPYMLQDLLYKDRELLDGWDKVMSIYCTEDWPYFRRFRESFMHHMGSDKDVILSILPDIRKAINERGPLSSIELGFDQTVDWPWAPTRLSRAALESMYFRGELIIHHKVHTRKVYDFASRHIPEGLLNASDPNETEEQYQDWYVLRRIGGVGLLWDKSGEAWLGNSKIKSKERKAAIARLLQQEKLMEVYVEGMDYPLYMRSQDKPCLDRVLESNSSIPYAAIIAPLDNLLWDRRLISELFSFDYCWEVYKPENERRYGYYVLPVLHNDKFIARFEPGWEKKSNTLIIKNWWWEDGIKQSKGMRRDLIRCFKRFSDYLDADKICVEDSALEQAGLDWLVI